MENAITNVAKFDVSKQAQSDNRLNADNQIIANDDLPIIADDDLADETFKAERTDHPFDQDAGQALPEDELHIYQDETQLHQDETQLSMPKQIASGSWIWNVARGQITWSSSFAQALGLNQDTGLNLSLIDVQKRIHPTSPNLIDLSESWLQDKIKDIEISLYMQHANGAWCPVTLQGQILSPSESGEFIFIGAAVIELDPVSTHGSNGTHDSNGSNEHSQAVDYSSLLNYNYLMQEGINSISHAFVIWNKDQQLVMCNEAFQKLNNVGANYLSYGTSFNDVMRNAPVQTVAEIIEAPYGSQPEIRKYNTQSDAGTWLEITEKKLSDGSYVAIGEDITERRTSEQRHQWMLKQQEYLTQKFQREKELAQAENETKSVFLSHLSHELRTPLNHIMGFADLMAEEPYGPLGNQRYVDYVRDIQTSSEALMTLIHDILEFADIQSGNTDIDPCEVKLDDILETIQRSNDSVLMNRNITIENRISPDFSLLCDPSAVERIFQNILTEAIYAMADDSTITLYAEEDGKDIAIGVITSQQTKPLSLQKTGYAADIARQNGAGMGLALSKALTELHGGEFALEKDQVWANDFGANDFGTSEHGTVDFGNTIVVKLPLYNKEVQLAHTNAA